MSQLRVCVLSPIPDHPIAQLITTTLCERGWAARIDSPDTQDDAVVILLGDNLSPLLSSIASLPARLVPVNTGEVDPEQIPDTIAALNWIIWSDRNHEMALNAITSACETNLDSLRLTEGIQARAHGWDMSGRKNKDLASSYKELRRLEAGLSKTQLSPTTRDFLTLSRQAAQINRIRSLGQRLVWTLLVIAIAFTGSQAWSTFRYFQDTRIALLAASFDDIPSASHVAIPKLATLIKASDEREKPVPLNAVTRLISLISQPSAVQYMSLSPSGMIINKIAFGGNEDFLASSGDGILWKGRIGDQDLTEVETLPNKGFYLAANEALDTWASSDGGAITVHQGDGNRVLSDSPGELTQLAMQGDGSALLAVTRDGAVGYNLVFQTPPVSFPTFIGYGDVGGRLTAAVRSDEGIELVEVGSGTVVARIPVSGEINKVTITPNGWVIFDKDQRLWISDGGEPRELSVRLKTPGLQLMALSNNEIFVSTAAGGSQIIDLNFDIILSEVCDSSYTRYAQASPNGRWLVCNTNGNNLFYDLNDFRPIGPGTTKTGLLEDSQSEITARILEGKIEITRGEITNTHDPRGISNPAAWISREPDGNVEGALNSVALSRNGTSIAYGTDTGEIVTADIMTDLSLLVNNSVTLPLPTPIGQLEFSDTTLEISTVDATWSIDTCIGCTGDRDRLWQYFQAHLLPCYYPSLLEAVPAKIANKLGLSICEEGPLNDE